MIRAANRILQIINPDTKVIPGHGPLSNQAELKEYRTMLVTMRDRIEQLVKEGKTLEEALQAKPTQGFYEDPASSFPPEGFVKVVYMELAEMK